MAGEITRRAGTEADREFLFELLKRSLGPHIRATYGAWNEAWQRRRFLETSDPTAHEIVESEGAAIGCLLVEESVGAVALHRVFLLPEHQNRGIGTELVSELLRAASRRGKPVRLRVFRVSPAVRLYERLGFRRVGLTDTHLLMEHPARPAAGQPGNRRLRRAP